MWIMFLCLFFVFDRLEYCLTRLRGHLTHGVWKDNVTPKRKYLLLLLFIFIYLFIFYLFIYFFVYKFLVDLKSHSRVS